MRPDAASVTGALAAAGVDVTGVSDETLGTVVRLECAGVETALAALKGAGYGMLVDLFAIDSGEGLELTYHVRCLADKRELFVKVAAGYDAEAPSVWRVHPAALYPEREAAELFGITFAGHPNPKRLLTTDEVEGHLLRKSVAIRSYDEVAL